ncbi:hypothetical protein NGB98_01615 [Mammaliicoccus sciuri]|uniref:hypothetical protein n=1 Tax=Mammaliicoccus sciuri TaxID=1296 RepID=UPI002DBA90FF|nr:hypothetical protein [Mammaliicoccus sciuri]MEB7423301.1 hypothetical protein [Mammaliicoccus sciuri]
MTEKTQLNEDTIKLLKENLNFDSDEKENIDNDAETAVDDIQDFYKYKKHLRESAKTQIDFKDSIRKKALITFLVLTTLLLVNLLIMLYLPNVEIKIKGFYYKFPKFDIKLVMFFASVTFINIFGLIMFIFRYIFSPTTDLLNHNKDLSK